MLKKIAQFFRKTYVISKQQDEDVKNIAKDIEEYAKADKAKLPIKILMIPSYYQISFTRLRDIFMFLSLRARRAEIVPVLCSGFYPKECMVYGGNYKKNRKNLCKNDCFITKAIWKDLLKTNPVLLKEFRKEEDACLAHEIACGVSFKNYKGINFKGYKVGIEAAKAVANLYDMSMIEDRPEIVDALKIHVQNIIELISAYERVIEFIKPDVILSNIPFYYQWDAAFFAAQKKEIPFYGIGITERKNSCYFLYNSNKIYDFSQGWNSFKNTPLDDEAEKTIEKTLARRCQGKYFSQSYYKHSNMDSGEYRKMRNWQRRDKPTVFFSVNIPSDAVVLVKSYVFESLFEMVRETLDYFAEHKEYQLIIKAHPAEEQFYQGDILSQKYCLGNIISQFGKLPGNIFFIDYDSPISSFDIFPLIDLGIMISSSAAIEMAWIGKPSITTAESHYSDKGFTYEAKTKEEYYALIKKILSYGEGDSVIKERIELSKKYFYYYVFHGFVQFNLFQGHEYDSVKSKLLFKDFREILPGKNRALDYICDAIINRLPIYGDKRWPPFTCLSEDK